MEPYIAIAAENATEEQRLGIENYLYNLNGRIVQLHPGFVVLKEGYGVSYSLEKDKIVLRFVSDKTENIESAVEEALKIFPEFKRVKMRSCSAMER